MPMPPPPPYCVWGWPCRALSGGQGPRVEEAMMLELAALPDLEAAMPPLTAGGEEKSGDPAWDAVREDVCRPFTIINFLRVRNEIDHRPTVHIF